MMKAVALLLVFTSLVAAGRSPPPAKTVQIKQEREVIVKEGHRHVEIEYGQEAANTKIIILPSSVSSEGEGEAKHAGEGTVGKVKDAINKAGDVKEKIKEAVMETGESVTDAAKGKARDVAEKAGEATEKVKGAAKDAAESAKEKLGGEAQETLDTANTLQKDVRGNTTKFVINFLNNVLPTGLCASAGMKLLGFSLAYGTAVWVTLISSYVTADALPRQQFAVLQSKLYPVYFKVIASGIGMVLLSHCLSSASAIQALNLFASLVLVLFNLNYLEPRANKIMFEMMKLEKEEGRGMEHPADEPSVVRNIDSLVAPLIGKSPSARASMNPSEKPQARADTSSASRSRMVEMSTNLKRLNLYSSLLNIITILSLTWHLFHLAQMIKP